MRICLWFSRSCLSSYNLIHLCESKVETERLDDRIEVIYCQLRQRRVNQNDVFELRGLILSYSMAPHATANEMRDQEQQHQDDGEDSDHGYPAWCLVDGSQDRLYVGFGTGGKVDRQNFMLFVLFTQPVPSSTPRLIH